MKDHDAHTPRLQRAGRLREYELAVMNKHRVCTHGSRAVDQPPVVIPRRAPAKCIAVDRETMGKPVAEDSVKRCLLLDDVESNDRDAIRMQAAFPRCRETSLAKVAAQDDFHSAACFAGATAAIAARATPRAQWS
jgi:hypothetical protein